MSDATASAADPVAFMYPSDLERFQTSETFATAYSVAVGCPHERSVPLYASAPPFPALNDEQLDACLERILRASGSSLRHYSMQKSKDDMRAAMRAVVDIATGSAA